MNWYRTRSNVKEDSQSMSRWEQDYTLSEVDTQGLFYEYLEMVIQFGFITIFVSAFPLGPLFALINNLIEVRIDAYKFVAVYRRPLAERTQDIGVWYNILDSVAKISVVINAFVIGFVSEFVPRVFFMMRNGSMEGYLNQSLSCFDTRDFPSGNAPQVPFNMRNGSCGFGLPTCRYRGFYEPPVVNATDGVMDNMNKYNLSAYHWHIIASKLFFIVVFEHFVLFVTGFIAWAIPDVPWQLHNQIKRENFVAREATRVAKATQAANPATLERRNKAQA